MLFARPLCGLGAADQGVAQLQAALAQLATVTGNTSINPQSTDGAMTDATMAAVVAALGILTNELPTYASITIRASLLVGATTDAAKRVITTYAPILASAANLAAAKYASQHPIPATPTVISEAPWYQTPIGIGGLLVGAFFLYKLLFASSSQKAAA